MINIEVWSDINCPFCYIGKRHLEAALKKFSATVSVEWKSFELDPMANPPKGVSQSELLAKKYGKDLAWANEMNKNMTKMAADAGLDFKMNQLVPANSFQAHRLIHLAKANGKQDEMKERLLRARFTEGLDIGNIDVLKSLAKELKLDASAFFETEQFTDEVRADETLAQELGISGVPFFVFNKKIALSGAQPVDVFLEVLEKVSH
jgi:predicted DsbA family dithiol-disulfide isomerase